MIRYDLACEREHAFDGWFRDSEGYDAQRAAGQVVCPVCGSTAIAKQLMTPGIPARSNRRSEERVPVFAAQKEGRVAELMEAVRKLRRHVEENADYVGNKFAEEARKMHYKEVEPRGIYGEATLEEAKALLEEGVEVEPLPPLPEDTN
jgi:hypothetical protein